MKTERKLGTLLYDAECGFCRRTTRFLALVFSRFEFLPLQSAWAREQLRLKPGELPEELKLVTRAGEVHGGIDALLVMAKSVPWMAPFVVLARISPVKKALSAAYRIVARRRYCLGGKCGL